MKLYEIDNAIESVIERGYSFDEETGEVHFDASNLEELQAARSDKLEACAIVLKNLDAEAAAMILEEKKLKERRQIIERKRASLREYVTNSMIRAGETKLDTPRAALSFRKSERVKIIDETTIPNKYIVETTTSRPNKIKIKLALQAGEHIAGALLYTIENLQVK